VQVLSPTPPGAVSAQGALIHLDALALDVIIGIFPQERVTRQRLTLSICLELPAASFWVAADRGALEASVNYAHVAAVARFVAQEGRFRLVESLLGALARLLLSAPVAREGRGALRGVQLLAQKPSVLGGNPVPGVSLRCAAGSIPPASPSRLRLLPAPPPPTVEEWQALTRADRRLGRPLDAGLSASLSPSHAPPPPVNTPTAPQSLVSAQLGVEPTALPSLESISALDEVQVARVLCATGEVVGARLPPQVQLMPLAGDWIALRRQPPQALWALVDDEARRYPEGQLCLLPVCEPVSGALFEAVWCVGGGGALWVVCPLVGGGVIGARHVLCV
jgi:FolB domain-containing protein